MIASISSHINIAALSLLLTASVFLLSSPVRGGGPMWRLPDLASDLALGRRRLSLCLMYWAGTLGNL